MRKKLAVVSILLAACTVIFLAGCKSGEQYRSAEVPLQDSTVVCAEIKVSRDERDFVSAAVVKVFSKPITSIDSQCLGPNQIAVLKRDQELLRKSILVALQQLDCAAESDHCDDAKIQVSPGWQTALPFRKKLVLRTFYVSGTRENLQFNFLFAYKSTYVTHGISLWYQANQLQNVILDVVVND